MRCLGSVAVFSILLPAHLHDTTQLHKVLALCCAPQLLVQRPPDQGLGQSIWQLLLLLLVIKKMRLKGEGAVNVPSSCSVTDLCNYSVDLFWKRRSVSSFLASDIEELLFVLDRAILC